jgi:hypothetical protein
VAITTLLPLIGGRIGNHYELTPPVVPLRKSFYRSDCGDFQRVPADARDAHSHCCMRVAQQRRAIVALARRMVLHPMWVDGSEFRWGKDSAAAPTVA